MKPIRRILCATDFSTASRGASTTAVTMAKSLHARLTILHVIAPVVPPAPERFVDAMTLDRLLAEARRWALRQLAKLARAAGKRGIRATTLVRLGDPAEQIVRAARSTGADVIVIGTHGRRGWSKFLLGSVAERVVATARCPVVTVRGR
jgi:nucleotide-binding universal stress UspA family protein